MHKSVLAIGLSLSVYAGAAPAVAEEANAPAPACKTAEINPVTGHVFCIDPLGAAVEAPPESLKPKCEEQSRGQWTWAPNCTAEPQG